MTPLVKDLRRRRLFEWALAYLAMAWLVLQVLDVLNEVWPITQEFQRSVHVALGLAFPFVLAVSWFRGAPGKQGTSVPEVLVLTLLATLAGVSLFLILRAGPTSSWVISAVSVVAMALMPVVGVLAWRVRQEPSVAAAAQPADVSEGEWADKLREMRQRLIAARDQTELQRLSSELRAIVDSGVNRPDVLTLALQVEDAMRRQNPATPFEPPTRWLAAEPMRGGSGKRTIPTAKRVIPTATALGVLAVVWWVGRFGALFQQTTLILGVLAIACLAMFILGRHGDRSDTHLQSGDGGPAT